jgi:hypothetical protein
MRAAPSDGSATTAQLRNASKAAKQASVGFDLDDRGELLATLWISPSRAATVRPSTLRAAVVILQRKHATWRWRRPQVLIGSRYE